MVIASLVNFHRKSQPQSLRAGENGITVARAKLFYILRQVGTRAIVPRTNEFQTNFGHKTCERHSQVSCLK